MNKYGFTVIELLISIVIFSLITLLALFFVKDQKEELKEKTNDEFENEIITIVNQYLEDNIDNLNFDTYYSENTDITHEISFLKLKEDGLLTSSLANPQNKQVCDLEECSFYAGRNNNDNSSCYGIKLDCLETNITNCQ